MAMTPALRTRPPSAARSRVAAISPELKLVELRAWISQPGDLDDGVWPKPQPRRRGQIQEIDPDGRHVFADLTRTDTEAAPRELGKELRVHEVHLSQVRLGGVARDSRAMLHGAATMRVAVDAQPNHKIDVRHNLFTKGVRRAATDGCDERGHPVKVRLYRTLTLALTPQSQPVMQASLC